MAGNPDQQEDPVDDQYQEDLEDEVCNPNLLQGSEACPGPPEHHWFIVSMLVKAQEDVAGGQKRDVEEEDPYNEENMGQVSSPEEADPGSSFPSRRSRPRGPGSCCTFSEAPPVEGRRTEKISSSVGPPRHWKLTSHQRYLVPGSGLVAVT